MKSWMGAAVLLGLWAVQAQNAPVAPFPKNYTKGLVLYGMGDRSDGKSRDFYASSAAIDAARRGQELPVGSMLVLETFRAKEAQGGGFLKDSKGFLVRDRPEHELHVMLKVAPESALSKAWVFGAYDPSTGQPQAGTNPLSDCLFCHTEALGTDMLFSFKELKAFAQSGQLQRIDCPLPERQPCPPPRTE
ncbi:cytochrome P460 family protein [Meiothermus granaticius]|uniref:Cytochrome P460 n=1 Tax=Meiothermus granaticius NBRC 107808 TaxID=1227551 RepID=A0A399FD71_9DEIN|nr:cytochrome P460 family protein [Meiothermus granaticius]RIH93339.1 Cytochrome P460 [Meiothermus granaticius NBRC 107808]